jgi:hypothetical protein
VEKKKCANINLMLNLEVYGVHVISVPANW